MALQSRSAVFQANCSRAIELGSQVWWKDGIWHSRWSLLAQTGDFECILFCNYKCKWSFVVAFICQWRTVLCVCKSNFYFYFCQFQLHWTINKNRKIKPNMDIYMDIFTVKWFRPQGLRHIPIETNIYLLFFERLQLTSVTSWLTNLMRVTRTRLDTVSDFWPCTASAFNVMYEWFFFPFLAECGLDSAHRCESLIWFSWLRFRDWDTERWRDGGGGGNMKRRFEYAPYHHDEGWPISTCIWWWIEISW